MLRYIARCLGQYCGWDAKREVWVIPTVQTATGPVPAEALGFTLSHEHVTVVYGSGLGVAFSFLFDPEATRAKATRHLAEAKAGGVDSIIDLSTLDLGRNVGMCAQVSRDSGVNIVVATGFWRDIPRLFWDADPDFIASVFVHEIEHGIGETGIRPGVIKVANDAEGVTPAGERVLRGAARACNATGVPISTHHWAPLEVGRRQLEIFKEEHVPMHLVCIGHSADTTDVAYLEDLLTSGCYLSMDRYPGGAGQPAWQERNATVTALIERGYCSRLMLGHDYGVRSVVRGMTYDSDPDRHPTRYLFLKNTAIPALLADGVTEEQINAMTVEAPRRYLAGEGPH
ncbi:MAG: phosphotriesterase-related protein [Mycobacterium sp.]|nr:phosphotriesterase-related protein [Mycobacterium sp.]